MFGPNQPWLADIDRQHVKQAVNTTYIQSGLQMLNANKLRAIKRGMMHFRLAQKRMPHSIPYPRTNIDRQHVKQVVNTNTQTGLQTLNASKLRAIKRGMMHFRLAQKRMPHFISHPRTNIDRQHVKQVVYTNTQTGLQTLNASKLRAIKRGMMHFRLAQKRMPHFISHPRTNTDRQHVKQVVNTNTQTGLQTLNASKLRAIKRGMMHFRLAQKRMPHSISQTIMNE